ncbi:hypothetical protein, partial [Nereida sp. MMG025]|uniref:hypothetical protein n=1 Tax=Nereida sp. MMG025 TaxID=2909981 RepID=UPI001F21F410
LPCRLAPRAIKLTYRLKASVAGTTPQSFQITDLQNTLLSQKAGRPALLRQARSAGGLGFRYLQYAQ